MSLPSVVTSQLDHGSCLSRIKTVTLKRGGTLTIKEMANPLGITDVGSFFEVFVSDEQRDLYIRDCLTQAVADYLNRSASPAEKALALGPHDARRRVASTELRDHISMGVLFLRNPEQDCRPEIYYTLTHCRDPYSSDLLRRRLAVSCLGNIRTIS